MMSRKNAYLSGFLKLKQEKRRENYIMKDEKSEISKISKIGKKTEKFCLTIRKEFSIIIHALWNA